MKKYTIPKALCYIFGSLFFIGLCDTPALYDEVITNIWVDALIMIAFGILLLIASQVHAVINDRENEDWLEFCKRNAPTSTNRKGQKYITNSKISNNGGYVNE